MVILDQDVPLFHWFAMAIALEGAAVDDLRAVRFSLLP